MGTFAGHALPGSFFIGYALWWTIQMFNRYYTCLQKNSKFTATVTFTCLCNCRSIKDFPIESIIKIVFVTIGFTLEIYTGYNFQIHKFTTPGNAQHATMFFFYGLSGVFDILVYFKLPMPKDLDYVVLIMAVGVEGLLFHFHLHGRTVLDTQLHTLLVYTIVFTLIAVILEMKYRHNILICLSRAFFCFLQGTWFWQIGFILYNPNPNAVPWKPDDHHEFLLVTMYFAWHCGIDFLLMIFIGGAVFCYQKKFRGYKEDEICMERLLKNRSNGNTLISVADSEDSDIDFQQPIRP